MTPHPDPTSLLLIGYGFRGRQWREWCVRNPNVRLAGVVDPDPEARHAAGRRGLMGWPSLDGALGGTNVAGAIIATPPEDHVRSATMCLAAGVAVLVEKPLALTAADAARVAGQAARTGRPALVVQNFRFLPRERAIRQVLDEGRIGRPLGVSMASTRAKRLRPLSARDVLWDFCIHHLDVLRDRFGSPARVRCAMPVADGLVVRIDLEWPDGLLATYRHAEPGTSYLYQEWLEGERGSVTVDDLRVTLFTHDRRARRVRAPRAPAPEETVLAEFLSAAHGATTDLTAAENLETVALVEAAETSARIGAAVPPDSTARMQP